MLYSFLIRSFCFETKNYWGFYCSLTKVRIQKHDCFHLTVPKTFIPTVLSRFLAFFSGDVIYGNLKTSEPIEAHSCSAYSFAIKQAQ